MIVELFIGNQKLDLFGDENILITSAVADITDITKNLTDYSRNFTVPASKVNNQIFKHYYNANIDNTFDARTKANSSIYINGVLFRDGKAQLNKVEIKKGKPSSYTLFFFGNLINLAKKLGDDKLSDLDLSAFDHPYDGSTIKQGLQTSLFSGDIKYCLFYKKQLFYNSNPSDNTVLDTIQNIAYQGGVNQTGVEFNFLKPSIRNIRIIEAIESKYGITFSRDFFGRAEFTDTYLWINNNNENTSGGGEIQPIFDGGDLMFIDPITNYFNITISRFLAYPPNSYSRFSIDFRVTPAVGFEATPYTIKYFRNGSLISTAIYPVGGIQTRFNTFTDSGEYEAYYEVSSELEFSFTTRLRQRGLDNIGFFEFIVIDITSTSSEQTIGSSFNTALELPDIEIIDYLKAFFQMFKLVVVPTGKNNLYVNTQKEYYRQGQIFDITKYVDQENYSVSRGELLNNINYSFEEPKAILNVEFEKQNNEFYGDEQLKIRVDQNDPNSELIDGKEENFEVPFETIVYDRITDLNDNQPTNIMYAPIIDEERKPVNPAPHIHYITNQNLGSKTIGFIDEFDNKSEVTQINIPLHCEKITNPSFSLLFSQELNEWDGSTMLNTLYSNYHAEYIFGIFNIKRRDYKYKARLPFNIITRITLDDVLQISENFYRIDNFTLNLTTGETELNLISSFGRINLFSADRTFINVDFNAQTESEYITNGQDVSFVKNDIGDGTAWVTVTVVGQIIYFEFLENTSPTQRVMTVTVTNNNNPIQQIEFTLIQEGTGIFTADTTIITADTNLITADNG
jgi:hypothetical protein